MYQTNWPKVGHFLGSLFFFGMSTIFAVLSQCRLEVMRSEKLFTTSIRSFLMISQHDLKKAVVHPSEPGAWSCGSSDTAMSTSSSVILASRRCRDARCRFIGSQSKSTSLGPAASRVFERWSKTSCSFSSWDVTQPSSLRNLWINFLRHWAFILRRKNFMLASPSLRCRMHELCFLLACSRTARPRTFSFKFALKSCSWEDRGHAWYCRSSPLILSVQIIYVLWI